MDRLRRRLAALEGTTRGVQMLVVHPSIADDPAALERFIAEHRAATRWTGRLELVALPPPSPDMETWMLEHSPAAGSA